MKRGRRRKKTDTSVVIRMTIGLLLMVTGLIIGLGALGFSGTFGTQAYRLTYSVFGIEALLIPLVLFGAGVTILMQQVFASFRTTIGTFLILASVIAFVGVLDHPSSGLIGGPAGFVGNWCGTQLQSFFGSPGALALLATIAIVGLALATDIVAIVELLRQGTTRASSSIGTMKIPALGKRGEDEDEVPFTDEDEEGAPATEPEHEHEAAPEKEPTVTMFNQPDQTAPASAAAIAIPNFDAEYTAPPVSILGEDKGKPGVGDIKANANIIKRTFQNFGISVEMDEVSVGPTVTRYAIKPAEGVRLQKIVALQQNLELALAAHPVRIEAPIPGKSLVGIEVPNASKAMVGLGGIISAPEWKTSTKPILAAVGRDIAGVPHYLNVAKMPHGLVAGATGSGKSVAIHAIITSLLYRNGPNQLRFIMVDPKRVELTLYNGIPHLLTPVITDPRKSIMALKWAAKEMDRRYNILEQEQVRDIESYHKTVVEPAKKRGGDSLPEAMPYIVIVIDELADIMQSYPRELEAGIVRLAQMSRAVGIHLILSTQRPSVNVITGLIKANVPTRMALQVASQIDSRTILDGAGAEQLLGAGDMLYLSADMQKPVRIQTAYISETEVKKVVSFIKEHNSGSLTSLDLGGGTNGAGGHEPNDAINLAGSMDDEDVDDDMYDQAKEAVEEAGRASTSYLQRKLRIGYSRAARLMDILEQKGVIGPADGARPRDVLSRGGGSAKSGDDSTEEQDF